MAPALISDGIECIDWPAIFCGTSSVILSSLHVSLGLHKHPLLVEGDLVERALTVQGRVSRLRILR